MDQNVLRTLFQIPNLVSLSRVFLTPVIGYYLALGDDRSTVICVVLLALAGISDGLDGYLARRRHQVTRLGISLDPIADKIFAGILVILLILYRDFPLWLAALIIGRDLLILAAGLVLLEGRKIVLPSNLTGKNAFGVIVILLVSYVIRFPFGILLTTYLSAGLIVLSTINYARVFIRTKRGEAVAPFKDKTVYKALRIGGWIVFSAVYLYELFVMLR